MWREEHSQEFDIKNLCEIDYSFHMKNLFWIWQIHILSTKCEIWLRWIICQLNAWRFFGLKVLFHSKCPSKHSLMECNLNQILYYMSFQNPVWFQLWWCYSEKVQLWSPFLWSQVRIYTVYCTCTKICIETLYKNPLMAL